jgi:hypothetical protein
VSNASLRPKNGARYRVERAEQDENRVIYRGFVHLPEADLPLSVQIELPSGVARAWLESEEGPANAEPRPTPKEGPADAEPRPTPKEGPANAEPRPALKERPELTKEAAALVRAATRAAVAAGAALPRKIERWRG